MQVLTYILSRAMPNIYVAAAEIVTTPIRARYRIQIRPSHIVYWTQFKERYPHWEKVGSRYGCMVFRFAPSFPSCVLLVEWLTDVLGLTNGEKNLLCLESKLINVGKHL